MGKILSAFWKNKGSLGVTFLLVILGLAVVALLPLLFIFGLRLMGLGVEYTWESWLGSLIVISLLNSSSPSKKD